LTHSVSSAKVDSDAAGSRRNQKQLEIPDCVLVEISYLFTTIGAVVLTIHSQKFSPTCPTPKTFTGEFLPKGRDQFNPIALRQNVFQVIKRLKTRVPLEK
jgi:hypothetical protein